MPSLLIEESKMVRATTLPQLAREDFFLGARLIFCLRGSNVITVATCAAPLSTTSPSLFNSISLSPTQRQSICFPQLQKRPCSSVASSSNPQQLGEVKAEKMQLSYTCKVPLDLLSEVKLKSLNYLHRCVIQGMWKWSANCPTLKELLLSSVRDAKTTI